MKTRIILLMLTMTAMAACNNSDEKKTEETVQTTTTTTSESQQTVSSGATEEGTLHTVALDSAAAALSLLPGEKHKELAESEGRWTTEMTYWTSANAAPQTTKGTCDIKMVLGGRYQQAIYKSETNGVPYEGIGYVAYDNSKKMYVNTWIDNTGTGVIYLEGDYNAATKTTEMTGKCLDPATCRQKGMRQVTRHPDKNTQILEMYETPDNGREFKSMEMKFARR